MIKIQKCFFRAPRANEMLKTVVTINHERGAKLRWMFVSMKDNVSLCTFSDRKVLEKVAGRIATSGDKHVMPITIEDAYAVATQCMKTNLVVVDDVLDDGTFVIAYKLHIDLPNARL